MIKYAGIYILVLLFSFGLAAQVNNYPDSKSELQKAFYYLEERGEVYFCFNLPGGGSYWSTIHFACNFNLV